MRRQTKYFTILECEQYEDGFPPENLTGFREWLDEIIAQIPPENIDTASIRIGSVSSYEDSHYATIEVTYNRPETDEEMAAREASEATARIAQRNAQEAKERATYEALKAKFG